MVGEVREVDLATARDAASMFLRVRVVIPIDVPLQRCLLVDLLGTGEVTILLLRYERLTDYCFHCGLVGYVLSTCPAGVGALEPLSDQKRRPKLVDSQIQRKGSSSRKVGKGVSSPKKQVKNIDVPISRKDRGSEKMGQVGAGDACMEALKIMHEHGETQFGGQDKLGDVIGKQVASSLVDLIYTGHDHVFLAFDGSLVDQLPYGLDKLVRPDTLGENSGVHNLVDKDSGIGLSEVFYIGPRANYSMKTKAGVWKRAARLKPLDSHKAALSSSLGL
ncbi:hypothetical protein Dsin_001495 [Dipteronia sinensis]|uniref:Zinc knuckle CX2CX4HX4C domain-containing protein n=1 Tax=Dipteronia sinensis TaxID=43782 RepID=A0AAE0EIT4_9ROSI|nr:hypothetical protein Dsin_001495 [Dipteronia sinensis]